MMWLAIVPVVAVVAFASGVWFAHVSAWIHAEGND